MRRSTTVGLIITVLIGTLALVAYATGNKGHSEKGHMLWSKYLQVAKDAEIEVTNIEDGVIITITSDNPDVIETVQQHWAKFREDLKSANPGLHEEGSLECDEAHESGECSGHEPGEEHQHSESVKHGHQEGSEQCIEAHESGECTGHQPGEEHQN